MNNIKKVIIHSVTHFTIYNFRLPLIKALQKQDIEVIALGKSDEYTKLLEEENIRCIDSKISIDGLNPIKELKWIFYLIKIFKEEKVNIVHHFTPKCVIFGSIASKVSGSKTISTISGLGYAFNLPKKHPIRLITKLLYYFSNYFTDFYTFQNIDDMKYFIRRGITSIRKSKLILSSGIDLNKYNYKKCENSNDNIVRFTFVGRLLYDKGIMEFLEASLKVSKLYNKVEFIIIGDKNYQNPALIKEKELNSFLNKTDKIKYIGKIKDIRPYLCITSILVLPSYREGIPRSVIEAMAYKKPIITTDAIGCRSTTKNGYNGFLVPIKNVDKIVEDMEYFIKNPKQIEIMGENSYKRVLSIFESSKVVNKTLKVYSKL